MSEVICTFCKKPAELVGGKKIYPHRPDLFHRKFYLCEDCDAYVGCHKGTHKPFGTPANAELRMFRRKAHSEFDLLWKKGPISRRAAYSELADHFGIAMDSCHIGLFDVEKCKQVIEFAQQYKLKEQV